MSCMTFRRPGEPYHGCSPSHQSFVLADIPGVIEGAADGAGLGLRFLKHLERTKFLLHLVDVMPADGSDPLSNAKSIVTELENYSQMLFQKPRWLVLSKIDLLPESEREARCQQLADALGAEQYYAISSLTKLGIKPLLHEIIDVLAQAK